MRVLEWLLEEDNPGMRFSALTMLLGRDPEAPDVRGLRSAAMQIDPIRTIMAHQEPEGHWGQPQRFYHGKYFGTVWQIIFLAQLAADPDDERIKRGCEFLFNRSQNRKTCGFSQSGTDRSGGTGSGQLPCLTGNLVWALQYFGYENDGRWARAVDWLLTTQQADGGWGHGGHSCFQGSVKPLKALVCLPQTYRSPAVETAIERAVEFFLQHRLFRRDHHGFDVAKPQHLRLGYPLGWQTDVLEMLDVTCPRS